STTSFRPAPPSRAASRGPACTPAKSAASSTISPPRWRTPWTRFSIATSIALRSSSNSIAAAFATPKVPAARAAASAAARTARNATSRPVSSASRRATVTSSRWARDRPSPPQPAMTINGPYAPRPASQHLQLLQPADQRRSHLGRVVAGDELALALALGHPQAQHLAAGQFGGQAAVEPDVGQGPLGDRLPPGGHQVLYPGQAQHVALVVRHGHDQRRARLDDLTSRGHLAGQPQDVAAPFRPLDHPDAGPAQALGDQIGDLPVVPVPGLAPGHDQVDGFQLLH